MKFDYNKEKYIDLGFTEAVKDRRAASIGGW